MAIDPRTPVLVGAGQYAHHAEGLDDALDPVGLMCVAIDRARADAGINALPDPDAIAVVSLLSWRYGDPAYFVAAQLGLNPAETLMTTAGGNSPQALVNTTARDIQDGRADFVILTGGEAWRTRMKARKAGVELDWPKAPEDQKPRLVGEELAMSHPAEQARGLYMPVQIYPMFETAIRNAAGRTVEEQLVVASELWSRFSAVAAANENAWLPVERSAEEIRTPTPSNRMIGFPYTKYMNSNNDVDMGAALIMCSAERAEALGIDRSRWVFLHAGTDCHEHAFISNRWSFDRTPAVELGARRALELAGMTIDDIDIVDLYSCFPSAVQLGAQSLGLPLDRQLTRTGGLAFAGGPWNNYVMHAIASLMDDLRAGDGRTGLVWANGGYATKHSFGVYGTEPPAAGFAHAYPQDDIDAMPRRELADGADAAGSVTIEAYTVMHDRDGRPEKALAACLLADGRRAWGMSTDVELATAMCSGEWVGRAVRLDDTGTLSVAPAGML
jgi:acetyl-CoA C-acetyltransferase